MANEWLQQVIVGAMVFGAALYLLRKYWPARCVATAQKSASGCGSCRGCSGGSCH